MQLLALYPSEPCISSRDPEAQQALNRATQGLHVIFSLLKMENNNVSRMRSCLHACLVREKLYAPPPGSQLRGQYQVFRRQDYAHTYTRTCMQRYIIIYYTLQREAQHEETGVRTTEDRMEKVRRELHLPVRQMYQVVLTYWMYLQRVTLSPSIQNGEASLMCSKDNISRTT